MNPNPPPPPKQKQVTRKHMPCLSLTSLQLTKIIARGLRDLVSQRSERAKGAAKASCGETVVQKGVCGESVSSLPPLMFALKTHENLKGAERKRTLQKHPLDNHLFARRLRRSFGAPPKEL